SQLEGAGSGGTASSATTASSSGAPTPAPDPTSAPAPTRPQPTTAPTTTRPKTSTSPSTSPPTPTTATPPPDGPHCYYDAHHEHPTVATDPSSGVSTGPTQQPGVFDLEAAVLDVAEAGLLGDAARLVVANSELEPEGAGSGSDRGPGHLRRGLGAAEPVDEVDGLGNLVKGG